MDEGYQRQFEAFAQARRPVLVKLARRLCAGGGIDSEDLVQETLERAYRNFDRLVGEPEAAVSVWLSKTLSNRFLDHCRRRRTEVMGVPALRVVQNQEVSADPEPLERWKRVSPEAFQGAISRLREPYRQVYELHRSGLRYRPISQQLRVPEGTVGRWLSEARQMLRELLDSDVLPPGAPAPERGRAER